MDHLDETRLLDLLREPPTARESAHLARCPECRRELELWETTMADLRELASQELTEPEMHNLRVLYRQLGPTRRRRIARLIPIPSAVPATRGALTASLAEYRAGSLSIVLHVAPSEQRGRYEIHGSLQDETRPLPGGTPVVLSSGEEIAGVTEADALGEFHFHDVPSGTYGVSCILDSGRVEVEDLAVGEDREDAGA